MSHRVIVMDRVSPPGLAVLDADPRFVVERFSDSGSPDFASALSEANGLIVRSATRVDSRMIESAPELRVIGRAGVGVDNIDVAAATRRGIAVFNSPAGNTTAAAELTMALMLSLARRVPAADLSIREGRWDRAVYEGIELRGRILGLIGAGRIGGEVARRARAFGMTVVAHDPYLGPERGVELDIELISFDDLIATSDVISLHVPLSDETVGMVDETVLARLKKGALIINVSRGGVVDEPALAEALSEGRLGGAALDVFGVEPLAADSPLRGAPNLVMTPHLGASTGEAQIGVAHEVALAILGALIDGDVSGAVNAGQLA